MTRRTKAKATRQAAAAAPQAAGTQYCIRVTHHLTTVSRTVLHVDAQPLEGVLAAVASAMELGRPFLADQGNGTTVILGISRDVAVEVMPWATFAEEQAQIAASEKRRQLAR